MDARLDWLLLRFQRAATGLAQNMTLNETPSLGITAAFRRVLERPLLDLAKNDKVDLLSRIQALLAFGNMALWCPDDVVLDWLDRGRLLEAVCSLISTHISESLSLSLTLTLSSDTCAADDDLDTTQLELGWILSTLLSRRDIALPERLIPYLARNLPHWLLHFTNRLPTKSVDLGDTERPEADQQQGTLVQMLTDLVSASNHFCYRSDDARVAEAIGSRAEQWVTALGRLLLRSTENKNHGLIHILRTVCNLSSINDTDDRVCSAMISAETGMMRALLQLLTPPAFSKPETKAANAEDDNGDVALQLCGQAWRLMSNLATCRNAPVVRLLVRRYGLATRARRLLQPLPLARLKECNSSLHILDEMLYTLRNLQCNRSLSLKDRRACFWLLAADTRCVSGLFDVMGLASTTLATGKQDEKQDGDNDDQAELDKAEKLFQQSLEQLVGMCSAAQRRCQRSAQGVQSALASIPSLPPLLLVVEADFAPNEDMRSLQDKCQL